LVHRRRSFSFVQGAPTTITAHIMFHQMSVEDLEHFFSNLPQQQAQHVVCAQPVHLPELALLPAQMHISSEDVDAFLCHLDSIFLRPAQVLEQSLCFSVEEKPSCQQLLFQQQELPCNHHHHHHHHHHYAHAVCVPDMDQAACASHPQMVPQRSHAGSTRSRSSLSISGLLIDQDAVANEALASPQLSPSSISLDGEVWPFGDMIGGQGADAADEPDLLPRALSAPASIKRKRYGRRTYTCEVCGFTCKDSGNIVRHRRRHNPERKYTCAVCGRGFDNSSNYKKHEQRCDAPKCDA
jgi:hypothetical protein